MTIASNHGTDCYGVHQVLLPQLIGCVLGVCNVLAVTWHCDHSCSYHSSECCTLFCHSSTAGRHWYGRVGKAMRWWWRPYWREGPLWICNKRFILLVVHFLTQAPNAYGTQNVVVVMAQEKPPEDTDRTGTVTITASPYLHCLHTILVRGGTIWSSLFGFFINFHA